MHHAGRLYTVTRCHAVRVRHRALEGLCVGFDECLSAAASFLCLRPLMRPQQAQLVRDPAEGHANVNTCVCVRAHVCAGAVPGVFGEKSKVVFPVFSDALPHEWLS